MNQNFWRSDITYGVKKDQNVESYFYTFNILFDVLIFDVLIFQRCDHPLKYFQRSDPLTKWFSMFWPPLNEFLICIIHNILSKNTIFRKVINQAVNYICNSQPKYNICCTYLQCVLSFIRSSFKFFCLKFFWNQNFAFFHLRPSFHSNSIFNY